MAKRTHPDYYYQIRDAIITKMGPIFNQKEYERLFPSVARPHKVIPYTDGYLAHRRIIMGLVKTRMAASHREVPKQQLSLVVS